MAPQANTLNVSTLPPFVDPLPIPPVAKPSGMRSLPSVAKTKLPYYRLAAQPVGDEDPSRPEADALLGVWWVGARADAGDAQRRRGAGRVGERACRSSIFCPSIIACMAPRPTSRKCAPWRTCTARTCRPTATAIPRTGSCPASRQLYHYPNQQDAAMLWYHDHAMGINRLNIYAGLFGVDIRARRGRGRPQSAQRQVRNPAGDLRPPDHARRPALLSRSPRNPARRGFPRSSATPFW